MSCFRAFSTSSFFGSLPQLWSQCAGWTLQILSHTFVHAVNSEFFAADYHCKFGVPAAQALAKSQRPRHRFWPFSSSQRKSLAPHCHTFHLRWKPYENRVTHTLVEHRNWNLRFKMVQVMTYWENMGKYWARASRTGCTTWSAKIRIACSSLSKSLLHICWIDVFFTWAWGVTSRNISQVSPGPVSSLSAWCYVLHGSTW